LWRFFFFSHYKNYCYLPLCIFCGDHLLCAKLRFSNIDNGTGPSVQSFWLAISSGGTTLAAGRDQIMHLWDLRRIRAQLAAMGLDWKATPYTVPDGEPAAETDGYSPLGGRSSESGTHCRGALGIASGCHRDRGTLNPDAWMKP
jgi:hypothetical protein